MVDEHEPEYDPVEVPDPGPLLRLWDWCKLVWATKKAMLAVWTFFFGVSGTALVGNFNETNPWKFGSEEAPIEEAIEDVPRETSAAPECVCPAHTHPVPPHTHPELQGLLPENHLELH